MSKGWSPSPPSGPGPPASPSSSYLEWDPAPTCGKCPSQGQEGRHCPGGMGVGSLDPCCPFEEQRGRTKMGLYWNLQ